MTTFEEAQEGDVLYTTTFHPNPASAVDVLAFVLAPNKAFASDPDELAAVCQLLDEAKLEAVQRWQKLRGQTRGVVRTRRAKRIS